MMNAYRGCIILACFPLLAACSGASPRTPVEPAPWLPGEYCADHLSQLASVVVEKAVRPTWSGEFRDVASCLRFNGKAQPVVLLDLRQTYPASLDIQLDLRGQYLLGAQARLLDEQFITLQEKVFDDFVQRPEHFSLRLYPHANDPAPAYLLIGTDPQSIGGQLDLISGRRVVSVWTGGGYMGAVADGVEDQHRKGIRDVGNFRLVIESAGLQPDTETGTD